MILLTAGGTGDWSVLTSAPAVALLTPLLVAGEGTPDIVNVNDNSVGLSFRELILPVRWPATRVQILWAAENWEFGREFGGDDLTHTHMGESSLAVRVFLWT